MPSSKGIGPDQICSDHCGIDEIEECCKKKCTNQRYYGYHYHRPSNWLWCNPIKEREFKSPNSDGIVPIDNIHIAYN